MSTEALYAAAKEVADDLSDQAEEMRVAAIIWAAADDRERAQSVGLEAQTLSGYARRLRLALAPLRDVIEGKGPNAERDAFVRERDQLLRWKSEATTLFDGLQDLGRALGIPLGVLITGPAALEAAARLRAERDAALACVTPPPRLAKTKGESDD